MEENEVSLPRATLVKLIKDYMPPDVRVASDATELIVACCTEFVALVGSEANSVAGRGGKKTVQPEHVLSALQDLGWPEFCDEVSATWEQFKEEAKASGAQKAALRKTGADEAGLTPEEQIALQQQMFAAARAASMTTADNAALMAAAYQQHLAAHHAAAAAGAAGSTSAAAAAAAAAAVTGAGSAPGGAGGTLPGGLMPPPPPMPHLPQPPAG